MDLRESLGRRLLLLDGATGTQLQARGLQPGQTPELWNIQRREDMTAWEDELQAPYEAVTNQEGLDYCTR